MYGTTRYVTRLESFLFSDSFSPGNFYFHPQTVSLGRAQLLNKHLHTAPCRDTNKGNTDLLLAKMILLNLSEI